MYNFFENSNLLFIYIVAELIYCSCFNTIAFELFSESSFMPFQIISLLIAKDEAILKAFEYGPYIIFYFKSSLKIKFLNFWIRQNMINLIDPLLYINYKNT